MDAGENEIDTARVLAIILLMACLAGWVLFAVIAPAINWGVAANHGLLQNSSFSLIALSVLMAMQIAVEDRVWGSFLVMQPGYWLLILWL